MSVVIFSQLRRLPATAINLFLLDSCRRRQDTPSRAVTILTPTPVS
jgi:hypothetical protein